MVGERPECSSEALDPCCFVELACMGQGKRVQRAPFVQPMAHACAGDAPVFSDVQQRHGAARASDCVDQPRMHIAAAVRDTDHALGGVAVCQSTTATAGETALVGLGLKAQPAHVPRAACTHASKGALSRPSIGWPTFLRERTSCFLVTMSVATMTIVMRMTARTTYTRAWQ